MLPNKFKYYNTSNLSDIYCMYLSLIILFLYCNTSYHTPTPATRSAITYIFVLDPTIHVLLLTIAIVLLIFQSVTHCLLPAKEHHHIL